ncbi:MAG: thiamine-monophosphate kinase [Pirellulaceae bacterium]
MESDFLAWLRQRIPTHAISPLGLSDDAALLRLSDPGRCVVSADMLMDGVDFVVGDCDPQHIGRKALAVSLSDMAAMAAQPSAAIVSVALPRKRGRPLAESLFEGLLPLAEEYEVTVAGGDTNSWDGPLVINVTVLGEVTSKGPLLRSGAMPGDEILVTGRFGGSILGRDFLFPPRVRESLLLHRQYELHAAIDVSDGLSLDLSRLADESGCGAVVQMDAIPVSEAARQLAAQTPSGGSALDHALCDGEDFELIIAAPPAEAHRILAQRPLNVPLTKIGHIVEQPGLWQARAEGKPKPLTPAGYQHRLDP